MLNEHQDPLAGRSRAFRLALKAVEDMGRREASRGQARGPEDRGAEAEQDVAPERTDTEPGAAVRVSR